MVYIIFLISIAVHSPNVYNGVYYHRHDMAFDAKYVYYDFVRELLFLNDSVRQAEEKLYDNKGEL